LCNNQRGQSLRNRVIAFGLLQPCGPDARH
jgi:hypothetical protein